MGESADDRLSMLRTLANLSPHPDSVPVNVLSRVPGTPMAGNAEVPFWETLRVVAVARLMMPAATVRLSAGAGRPVGVGAGPVLHGRRELDLLQRPADHADHGPPGSSDYDQDKAMLATLGLTMRPPFKDGTAAAGRRGELAAV